MCLDLNFDDLTDFIQGRLGAKGQAAYRAVFCRLGQIDGFIDDRQVRPWRSAMARTTGLLSAIEPCRPRYAALLRRRRTLFLGFFAKQPVLQVFNFGILEEQFLFKFFNPGFGSAMQRLPIMCLCFKLDVLLFGYRDPFL